MPLTRRDAKLIKFLLLSFLLTWLPASAFAQSDEHANIQRRVEQFFAFLQQRDLSGAISMWSEKSPELPTVRQTLQETFAAYRKIELKGLRFNEITIENDNATVRVVAELNVVSDQASASTILLAAKRTFRMVNELGTWKILKYTTGEEELVTWLSTRTLAEGNAFLSTQPELVTPDLLKALTKQTREMIGRGKQVEALIMCDLALTIAERLSDKRGMFMTLRLKGDVYRSRGDNKQALEIFGQCLKLAEELGDKTVLGDALNSLAMVHYMESDYPTTLALLHRSLQIREELGDKLNIARELSNIGNIYLTQGDKVRALEYFERSLKLAKEVGNKAGAAATLNSIGNLYYSQSNYPQALEYFQQSLKIKEGVGDKLGVARALSHIGIIHSLQGQYAQALDYLQQNERIRQELGDKLGIVAALHNIGGVYLQKGNYTQALTYEHKALKPAEELGNNELLADILQNISESCLHLAQYTDASAYAERAASLATQVGIPAILWNARTIAGKAQLGLNQPQVARQNFLESIATIEKMRGQVVGGEQDQQRFFENKIAPYKAMVELSLTEHDPIQALSYAERAKGRVLLDVLSGGRVDITKGMTTDELKRDHTMLAEISSLNVQLARLKAQSKPNEKQVAELQSQLDKRRLEYEAFQSSLYVAHPELKVQRGETQMVTLDDAAVLMPDDRTAILEYVVMEDKTFLFVLQKTAQSNASGKGAVKLTVHTIDIKSSELTERTESFRKKVADRDLTVKQPARQLYDLLIRPAEAQLKDVKRLCIMPDGALWNLPFQALNRSDRGYLLEQYALFYAPSLSVLREMERRAKALATRDRRITSAASNVTRHGLLAIGNPALDDDTAAKARLAQRYEPLGPLPDAEREVKFLGRLYGPASNVLTGEQADETVVKAEANKYEILHFATHATLDDRNPLYSRIILARAKDRAREDGLLEAWEIMKLDLNASLTVLSACQTAGGRVTDGEGMIGISWALFVAGSPAAVVSQWKVDSARTTELMIEFHRSLLRKRGKAFTKSEALRQASVKFLHGPYNHPVYWAGFILIGDDN